MYYIIILIQYYILNIFTIQLYQGEHYERFKWLD
jgi:hypothetical protein